MTTVEEISRLSVLRDILWNPVAKTVWFVVGGWGWFTAFQEPDVQQSLSVYSLTHNAWPWWLWAIVVLGCGAALSLYGGVSLVHAARELQRPGIDVLPGDALEYYALVKRVDGTPLNETHRLVVRSRRLTPAQNVRVSVWELNGQKIPAALELRAMHDKTSVDLQHDTPWAFDILEYEYGDAFTIPGRPGYQLTLFLPIEMKVSISANDLATRWHWVRFSGEAGRRLVMTHSATATLPAGAVVPTITDAADERPQNGRRFRPGAVERVIDQIREHHKEAAALRAAELARPQPRLSLEWLAYNTVRIYNDGDRAAHGTAATIQVSEKFAIKITAHERLGHGDRVDVTAILDLDGPTTTAESKDEIVNFFRIASGLSSPITRHFKQYDLLKKVTEGGDIFEPLPPDLRVVFNLTYVDFEGRSYSTPHVLTYFDGSSEVRLRLAAAEDAVSAVPTAPIEDDRDGDPAW